MFWGLKWSAAVVSLSLSTVRRVRNAPNLATFFFKIQKEWVNTWINCMVRICEKGKYVIVAWLWRVKKWVRKYMWSFWAKILSDTFWYWYTMCLLRYFIDNNSSIHLPLIMLHTVYSNQCCKYSYPSDVLQYTWHLLPLCLSWERALFIVIYPVL